MPMGIVSDSDFDLERERLGGNSGTKQPNQSTSVIDINKGRGDKKETPKEIREAVALSAINGEGTGSEIARAFNVSESSVSAYKQGAHSTASYNEPNQSLFDKLTDHKQKISKKARSRLLAALNEITPDRLATVKPRDLAAIAKDMSAIISDMEPPIPISQNNQNNVQFVFMAPRVRNEADYAVIEVND